MEVTEYSLNEFEHVAILLCNHWLNEYAKAFDTLEGFAEWYDGGTNHEH